MFDSRSTFVKDRQIHDDVLIASEVVDEVKKDKRKLIMSEIILRKLTTRCICLTLTLFET
jgi:hypothetical protein